MQVSNPPVKSLFEAFGLAATLTADPTVMSGFYAIQRDAEESIAADVAGKLELCHSDRLVEIGCGPGAILRRLAPMVAEATGVDHPSCLAHVPMEAGSNIRLVAGSWPETRLEASFDKILVYSVLQCLATSSAAFSFIDACLAILNPGGR